MAEKPLTLPQAVMNGSAVVAFFGGILLMAAVLDRPGGQLGTGTIIVSAAIIAAAIVAFILAMRSQRRIQRREDLRAKARRGVFNLPQSQRTARLIAVTYELAERFQMRAATTDPVADATELLLGDLSRWICHKLEADADGPNYFVQPDPLQRVRNALRGAGVPGGGQAGLTDQLVSLLPTGRRSRWSGMARGLGLDLPRLTLSKTAVAVTGILSIGLTIATMVVLARWADREVPLSEPDPLFKVLGHYFGHWVFFLIAPVFIFGLRAVAKYVSAEFPEGCSTVGELAAFVGRNNRHARGATRWTQEQVWVEVRQVVADAYGMREESVTRQTPLALAAG